MKCTLCGDEWHGEKIPFSAVCGKCGCWMHSCVQCALWDYQAGMCRSMTTDSVADREGKNFCEEWKHCPEKEKTGSQDLAGKKFSSLFGG